MTDHFRRLIGKKCSMNLKAWSATFELFSRHLLFSKKFAALGTEAHSRSVLFSTDARNELMIEFTKY